MAKEKGPQIAISNCDSKTVSVNEDDLDQEGDNSFHCPLTAVWVNLKRGSDGKVVCSNHNCDHMPIWLS